MYDIFVSDGIVLGKRNVGESNTVVSVLTREHGLLRAKAASTRVEKSKLRFGLEPLTRARFSFVKGKHEWKLVGVEDVHVVGRAHGFSRMALGRISRLVIRLVQGEERIPGLFEHIESGIASIVEASSEESVRNIECVLVLRILFDLGYLSKDGNLSLFLESEEFSEEVTSQAAKVRSYLIRTINESLAHTGL